MTFNLDKLPMTDEERTATVLEFHLTAACLEKLITKYFNPESRLETLRAIHDMMAYSIEENMK